MCLHSGLALEDGNMICLHDSHRWCITIPLPSLVTTVSLIQKTNITRNVDPLLRPWTQQCHIFTGHFGFWQSTTKLSSVAKESLVQKIQQNWSYFGYTSPHLKFEDSNSVCLHASVAFDDAPPYHICLQEAEQFRIHFLDNAWTHTHLFQCTELRSVFINLQSGSL